MIYYKKKIQQDVGATAIEYGLIASLISVLAVGGMSAVGGNLSNTYCTVSKYLGGSGKCSGATSSSADSNGSTGGSNSTSGNGSAGSSTGSINNTNSIADGATIDQIKEGLSDELNLSDIPSSMGGTDSAYTSSLTYKNDFCDVTGISNALSGINTTDPITNVFGVYDEDNNLKPITDYNSVNDALQKGGGSITFGNSQSEIDTMEFTTASGKVYTVSKNGDVTENTKK
ncbi:Flp family type IVb pilin [Acetobacter sp.]|uniref:Flp family type IVb pilin n=1 Tax=Acetobacter sp. TaxID=440 RepID=UPI0039E81E7E